MSPTKRLVIDLKHESGPAEILMWSVDAGEALERDPDRYREKLPVGMKFGPHHGAGRLVH
jgi:hypothetical protein